MENLLFIVAKVLPNSSQGIRYRNLLKYFAKYYNITLISYNDFLTNDLNFNIEKVIINNKKELNIFVKKKNTIFNYTLHIIKYIIKKLIFPDVFIIKIINYRRILKKLLKNKSFDFIIIGVTPYSLYTLTKFLFKNSQAKIIIDLSDPFIENSNPIYSSKFKKILIKKYENYYLTYVEKIVVLNEKIKSLYSKVYNIKKNKIEVIEQGVEIPNVKNVKNKRICKLNKEKFTLVYGGTLDKKFRNPFNLYKAIENFPSDKIILKLYGAIKPYLLPNLKCNKFYYGGVIPQEKLFEEYLNADLTILIDNNYGYQIPGKTLELIAYKIPILFIYRNNFSPTLDYLKNYKGCIIINDDFNEILNALKKAYNNEFDFNFEYDIDKYSWNELSRKYYLFINF